MALAPQIIGLDEDDDYVNLMVYGKPGSGKTVLGGSDDRVLFLAPEDDGTISAKRQGSKARKWPIDDWNDLADACEWVEENMEEVQATFDWIVVDSITFMQKLLMRRILEDAVEENPERNPDVPAMQDWQVYQNRFLRFVQMINSWPINVLWTALVRDEEDEEENPILVPDIQGKGYQMAMTVASYMTSFGNLRVEMRKVKKDGAFVKDSDGEYVKKPHRVIIWQDQGNIQGKDRTNVLAPKTQDVTLKQIRQLITGEITRDDLKPKRPAAKKAAPAAKKAASAARTKASTTEKESPKEDSVGTQEGDGN
ncbi:AAA-ATPase [Gordonia phage Sienna]|uniref:AAA-ATPase n=1 Tax=Gordonia phage Sienna TaxID=2759396 RepID=A0A7L7SIX7_9CAUD|nr:AAA-ATPase [Gordonia phage Sienna]